MSQRPPDLPREPYRALAVFLILPLVTAAIGARYRAPGAPAATHAEASLGGVGLVPAPPVSAARPPVHPRLPSMR